MPPLAVFDLHDPHVGIKAVLATQVFIRLGFRYARRRKPRNPAPPDLAEPLFEALAEHPHTRLVLYERAIEMAERLAPRPVVQPTLGVLNAAYVRADWRLLEGELGQLGATELRAFLAERLHDKSRITAIGASLGDGGSLWIGPVIESNNANPELFARFYPRVLRVIRTHPLRTPERVAALLTALRVRTGTQG